MARTGADLLARLRHVSPWAIDAVLATCFVAIALLTTGRGAGSTAGYEPRDALAVALILLGTVPYYARRAAPLPVFVVTTSAVVALGLLGYDYGAMPTVLLVGAYTVASYRKPPEIALAALAIVAAIAALYLGDSPDFGVGELVAGPLMYAAAFFLGWTVQTRRRHVRVLEDQQHEASLRAAADERLRIAQELHDVVAHSLGVIAVQAGAGMQVIDRDPAQAKEALEHISRTSRASLAEIRRLLGIVRSGDGPATYSPAPGLADLPRLSRDVSGAGLPVRLELDPELGELAPGVELAAYRIVQEALTNSLRHADARSATVVVAERQGRLDILVTDDGRNAPGAAGPVGHGLVGMRERVAVYGGTFDAGPRREGGFRVEASFPVRDEASS